MILYDALTLFHGTSKLNVFHGGGVYMTPPPAKSPIFGLEWRILHENSSTKNFQTI